MIFVGWGKNIKKIGYYGVLKCSHCKNYADFDVCELSNNIKLYFVTVAKYNKKRYLRCAACSCGYELDEGQYNEILALLPKRFDKATTDEIWDLIDAKIAQSEGTIDVEDVDKIKAELVEKYKNAENVSEIVDMYLQCVVDDDKAR